MIQMNTSKGRKLTGTRQLLQSLEGVERCSMLYSYWMVTAASKFYRAITQAPASANGLLTLWPHLAELNLTLSNLRRLEPVPEDEQPYITGLASYSTYHVWIAGTDTGPLYLGSIDVPLFGQGQFYCSFDPNNINDSGSTLSQYTWLLVTGGGEHDCDTWIEDVTAGVLYGTIPPATDRPCRSEPPLQLFEQHKEHCQDMQDLALEFDIYDEDIDEEDLFEP